MFNHLINQLGSWPYLLATLVVAEFLTMLSFLSSSYYWGRMVRKEPAGSLFRSSAGFGLTFGGLAIAGSGFLSWALAGGGVDGVSLAGVIAFTLLVAVAPCLIYYVPFRWFWIPFVRPLSHLLYALAAAFSYWLLFSLNGQSGQFSVEFLLAMWACHLYVANSWEAHGWAFVENSTADKGWLVWFKSFTGENRQSFISMVWMWHFYFVVGGLIATHFALSFVSDPAALPIPVAAYLSWLNEIGLFSSTVVILLAMSLMLLTAHTETIRGTREIRNRALAGRAVLVTTVDEQRKTIENQVERLLEAERENIRNQQKFMGYLAHEIRTPLAAMRNAVSLANHAKATDAIRRRALDTLDSSTSNLLNLLNDALDSFKYGQTDFALQQSEFSVSQFLTSVETLYSGLAQSRGLIFSVETDAPEGQTLIGDSMRLGQMISNLISNAIKFTDKGGVYVRLIMTDPERDLWRFEVRDTGPGISQEDQERLFKPFMQLNDGPQERITGMKGTGLGLSIVAQLAQAMGGRAGLTSELGQGSTFYFEVPLPSVSKSHVSAMTA